MKYIIEKKINRTDKYEFYAIKRKMMKYCKILESKKQNKCFDCREKFTIGQELTVLFSTKTHNKLVCDKCGEKAESSMEEGK